MKTPTKRPSRPKPLTRNERLGIRHSAVILAIDHCRNLQTPMLVRDLIENADQIAIYLETGKPLVVVGVDERGNPVTPVTSPTASAPVSRTMKQIGEKLEKNLAGTKPAKPEPKPGRMFKRTV